MVAQYDDMSRHLRDLTTDNAKLQRELEIRDHCFDRELKRVKQLFDKEKELIRSDSESLQKEIRKLNRQLAEARSALVREAEDKKSIARERKSLLDQMRRVRELVLNEEEYGRNDAHRRRVIKCLDVDKLSTIQSDDSDDCVADLDYDRTEEEIIDNDRSRRSNARDDDLLEDLANHNDQPTLLYRYIDRGSDNENQHKVETRRSSRRNENGRSSYTRSSIVGAAEIAAAAELVKKNKERIASMALDTDSNTVDTDDQEIENVRQQWQNYEESKKERMAPTISTPSIKSHKGATISAKSAASLMRNLSTKNCSTPVPAGHKFQHKRSFKPNNCGPCGKKLAFYSFAVSCENCGIVSHVECQNQCPLPCVKITTPCAKSRSRKILISDYVNNDAIPKVPALIIHCCNEIEREDNITTDGLYRAAARTTEVEELHQKILKSKTGMPNLSKYDVHLLTNVVKRFLQSLDESLITTTLWSHLSEAAKQHTGLEKLQYFTYFIGVDLPTANRETLAYLMLHLHAIAKQSDKNLMTKESLAKALAPTIVGNSCRNPPTSTILQENKTQLQIMLTLFEIEEDFWLKYVHKEPAGKTASLGTRLLEAPQSSSGVKTRSSTRTSRFIGATLPTPKMKPLFSS